MASLSNKREASMITQAIKTQVEAKVNQCVALVEKKYGITFKKPKVSYNVRGTTGGYARYASWEVDFNPVLLSQNLQTYLIDVIPHEVAHLATKLIYPSALERRQGKKRSPHGSEWASIMIALGADPKRTHNMDTTDAKVRTMSKYAYKCSGCGYEYLLGVKRHNKLKAGVVMWHPACGRERGQLVPAKQATPTIKPVATTPKVPTGTSKIARCYRLFENYPGYTRAEMINVFVQECDCTAAGAATYYATCKKMAG
jgi:SprT protein